jgi:hypothetical protein
MPDEPNNSGPITKIAQSVVTALPPGMLFLALINVGFIGFMMWFLEDQLQQRNMMAEKLFNRCLEVSLRDTP